HPPEELRLALLGMRCDASTQGLHLVSTTMEDAEELLRSAPRGSIPWAQAMQSYYYAGLLRTGGTTDLLAAIALLREVEPAPEALGRMALVYLSGIFTLDSLGQVLKGNGL